MLKPWLESNGLAPGSCTQIVLYMAADSQGNATDGGGATVAAGKWAGHAVELFRAGDVTCKEVAAPTLLGGAGAECGEEFEIAMAEKLLWACIFWLVCDSFGGITVGEVVDRHSALVRALVHEMLPIVAAEVTPGARATLTEAEGGGRGGTGSGSGGGGGDGGGADRVVRGLCEYSKAIASAVPSRDMAVREIAWRNGWFLSRAPPTPEHSRLLESVGLSHLVAEPSQQS